MGFNMLTLDDLTTATKDVTPNNNPGVFVLVFKNGAKEAQFFIGATAGLKKQIRTYLFLLKKGISTVSALQKVYDLDKHYAVLFLNTSTRAQAFELKQQLLNRYLSDKACLNIGAYAESPRRGVKFTLETRERLSKSHLGRYFSDEAKRRLMNARLGKGRKVTINGVMYETITLAAKAVSFSTNTVSARVKSINWPDWHYTLEVEE